MSSMRMTLSELLATGEAALQEAGITEAPLDAWYLLEYVTGVSRTRYLCEWGQLAEEAQQKRYMELIQKRVTHIPLQHLTGEQEFMGLPFSVNEQVLIPRQDTEVLVEEVLKHLHPDAEVLDMCTGSGCILISLAHFVQLKRAVGADVSVEALKVAEQNRVRNQVQAEFICTDMFAHITGSFDCIVSNPPYIATEVIETLTEEVKDHEPRGALDGMEDGLFFYRILAQEAGAYLKPQGMLFLEIGYDQGESVLRLLRENGFEEIQVKKDLAGLDRVCYGRKRVKV